MEPKRAKARAPAPLEVEEVDEVEEVERTGVRVEADAAPAVDPTLELAYETDREAAVRPVPAADWPGMARWPSGSGSRRSGC